MAIKKVLIGTHEWHYAVVTQHDGSIAVVATKPDGTTQSLTITDLRYAPDKKTIQFMCNGRRFTMRIANSNDQNHVVCSANGKVITVKPIIYKQLSSLFLPAETTHTSSLDPKTIKSPLAGRITKILVSTGQSVLKGQPLLLIESMKMENEICAPANGSIKAIAICQGDVVKPNQVLLTLA